MSIIINERSFNTGIVTINYAEGPPSGAPLVLLHGGSARWQSFETIIPDLAAFWHIYAPDLRGHGKSGWVQGCYRLQDYADDMIEFIQQRLKEPACLIGHSLGGMVALLVAAQCPTYVHAVVVGDAPLTSKTFQAGISSDPDKLMEWRELAGGRYTVEEIIETLKDTYIRLPGEAKPIHMREAMGEDAPVFPWLATNLYHNDPDMLTALIDDIETTIAGYDMEVILPAIRCPVLLLQADPVSGGLMTDVEVAQALPLLEQSTHIRLEGISHVLHNEQKEPVLQAVITFLKSVIP